MTPEIKEEILAFGSKYFAYPKNQWTSDDLKEVYSMYNKIHGTSKQDQGCNSCRRDTISAVREAWMQARRETLPGSTF